MPKQPEFSKLTLEKAEAAKRFIEKKYSLNQIKAEQKAEQWKHFQQKITELHLNNQQEEQAKQQIIHEEMQQLRRRRQKVSKKNFTSLAVIGRGAFGQVRLCREIKSGKIVAIKSLKKKQMIKKNQQTHLRDERNVLADGSQWIVKLMYSFQDSVCLYLVMEFLPGGDLMTLLINNNVISENQARFYIAQTILAIESVHQLNYIHRDLKPDNILIDKEGHIKLSDFGLCKKTDINEEDDQLHFHKLKFKQSQKNFESKFTKAPLVSYEKMKKFKKRDRKLAFSAVGTPDYIAPEMLSRKGYDETVDWWSVGIMLYEMLIGYAPFTADANQQIYYKIQNHEEFLYFPPEVDMSNDVIDLISRLVTKAENRLGKGGVEQIKKHPWFKGINWNNIRGIQPPFVPDIKTEADVTYFDDYEEEEPWVYEGPETYRKDFNFIGYTYKDSEDKTEEIFDKVLVKLEDGKKKEMEKERMRLEEMKRNMKKKPQYGEIKGIRKFGEKSINILMNKSELITERSKNGKSKSPLVQNKKKVAKSPLKTQKSSALLKKSPISYSSTVLQKTLQITGRKSINNYK